MHVVQPRHHEQVRVIQDLVACGGRVRAVGGPDIGEPAAGVDDLGLPVAFDILVPGEERAALYVDGHLPHSYVTHA